MLGCRPWGVGGLLSAGHGRETADGMARWRLARWGSGRVEASIAQLDTARPRCGTGLVLSYRLVRNPRAVVVL